MPNCPSGSQQYVIQPGDTYYGLAQRYGVNVSDIIALNPGIDPNNLQVGQVICVPTTTGPSVSYPSYPPQPYPPYKGYHHHTIRPGETILDLSKRYNIPYHDIERHNPGIDHDHLRPGQVIHVPHR